MLKCSRHQTIHGLDEPLCCSSDHRGQTGLQSRQLGDSLEPVHCVVLRPLGRLLEFSQGGTDARQGQAGLSASESRGRQGRGLYCPGRGEGGQGCSLRSLQTGLRPSSLLDLRPRHHGERHPGQDRLQLQH